MRRALATITGNLYLVVGSFFWGLMSTLVGWIPPRGNWMFRCAQAWSRGILRASGVRVRCELDAAIQGDGRYIFMSNHQSLFDIPVLLKTLPGQVRFLAKASLFRLPLFGWGLAVGGFIPVDREDRSRAREVFATAVERLRAGASVLLFPEETRSPDGKLLPFQRGGFLLAMKSGLPIVPVGIRGTFEVRRKGSWVIQPGTVAIRYGPPIETAGFDLRRKRELVAEVRRAIARLAELEEPTAPAAEVIETAGKA